MRVIIIEDEKPAADKLEILLKRYDSAILVIGKARNVTDGIQLLEEKAQEADLIFMDIQLTDGLSFEIFDQMELKIPVIFITAFDQYALRAFKANGIDYILKPVTYTALKESMQKFESLKDTIRNRAEITNLSTALHKIADSNYKSRFMVKIGEHIHSITTDQINMFFAEGRDVYLINDHGRKLIIDHKMESLESLLDPKKYFRTNRSFIVNIDAIQDVLIYSNSRLKITMKVDFDKDIIVSRDKVNNFKSWYDGMTE